MKTAQIGIDYDLGGATYDITGTFSRHFTAPCDSGPYDADWQLDDIEVYLDCDLMPDDIFEGIHIIKINKFVTVMSDIEELLREQL